jgi:prefoldin subunit 5
MPVLEDLNKRKQEIESTLESLHELIERRNAILASVERLAFDRIITRKRTLLNLNSKNDKINFMRRSTKSIELVMKNARKCLFYLLSRERYLKRMLEEINANIDDLQGTRNDFVPKESS